MVLAEDVSDRIIGLYALGNRVSADTISAITDRVLPEIKAWKSRSLDSVYPIVFDYKVMDDRGHSVSRAIYNV